MAHSGRTMRIVAALEDNPPFAVDALVYEEDTFLVLSADPDVRDTQENPEPLLAELQDLEPKEPGTVLVEAGYPLRLLAIVYDLNQEPCWKEEWVIRALDEILHLAERQKLRSIALPPLGTLHGSLDQLRFVTLLRQALEKWSPSLLTRLWLVLSVGTSPKILEMLELALRK